jgi:hypothetical protein
MKRDKNENIKNWVVLMFICLLSGAKSYCHDLDEEINLRLGLSLKGQLSANSKKIEQIKESNKGISIGIEELVPVYDSVRFGLGFEYNAFPVNINKVELSAIAIYATLKVKPFIYNNNVLKKTYLKGNIGYSKALNAWVSIFRYGGLYYLLGIGYENSKNMFCELNHSMYKSYLNIDDNVDASFYKLGLDIGYKFYN